MSTLPTVLYRTPLLDQRGNMTREWIRFFESMATTTSTINNIINQTVVTGQATAFDDISATPSTILIDSQPGAFADWSAPVIPPADSPIDWSVTPQPQTVNQFVDLSELRRVTTDLLEAAAFLDTPQAPASPASILELLDTPRYSQDQDIVAWTADSPRPGATGTITLAALTGGGTQGSITVDNGIITGFVNPT